MIPTGLLGNEGKSKAHHESRYSGPMAEGLKQPNLQHSYDFHASNDQSRMPRRNAMPSLRRQCDYMRSISSISHGDEHSILSMLCSMLIFLFRCHSLLSSDVIDEHAVSQYASLFFVFYADYMLCYVLLLHTSPCSHMLSDHFTHVALFSWFRFLSYICM